MVENTAQVLPARPGPLARAQDALLALRDWLDSRGKGAWLVAMILAFVFVWPVGLAVLAYMIWSNRMFTCNKSARRMHQGHRFAATGNTAFDTYRDETIRRLEEEQRAFQDFLTRLREAKDKAEFDQFMHERDKPAA